MSVLPDRSKSSSNSFFSRKGSATRKSSDWEDEFESNITKQNLEYKIIYLANSKLSLSSTLNKYGVVLEQVFSTTGWTHRCSCPLPDHLDRRPSFGYNSAEDRFNCFGCHRSGQAVEFIALMEGKSKLDVAKQFVGDSISLEEISHIEVAQFDYKKLEELLFGYADFLREFKSKHNNTNKAINYANSVTWNLDVYIRKHAPFNTIVLDDLEVRILKLIEQLNAFEEKK